MRRLFRLPLRTDAQARADADAELASVLRARTEHLVARGMTPAAARAEALRRMGGPSLAAVRERLHHSAERREDRMRFRDALHRLRQDVRFAARQLARAPGFTLVAVLTLALGIGAGTAIFSAVNPVLFEPLPYPHAERIVAIVDRTTEGARLDPTFGTFRELAQRSRAFDALAATKPWQPTFTGPAEPERLDGQRVSATYFRVLGVSPALGRAFDASDDVPRGPRAVILGDGIWRRRFGGDRTIVGRTIALDGDQYLVVGVMPRGFENVPLPSAEVWAPLQYGMAMPQAWGHHLRLVGRVHAGVTTDDARREIDAIAHAPVPEIARPPWAEMKQGLLVSALQDDVTRGVRPALVAVLGAVVLLLAIACVNVTNLLLARGAQRRGEVALRAAIGAGRGRLVRQLLTESTLLATLGGLLGVGIAALGVRALVALAPPGLPRAGSIALDGRALAFALGITTLVGVATGLLPALHAVRGDLHGGVRHGARRTVGGHRRTRRTLVVAEVALALVLLVGSGLLLRSLQRLFAVAPGFDAARVLTMQVQTAGRRFDDDSVTHRFFAAALDAARRVPGVMAAAWTSQLPLSGDLDEYGVHFASAPNGHADADGGALRYAVTPDYLATMRIPLRRGRVLDARDVAGAPRVALVNESFARRQFPGVDPIGQRLRMGPDDGPWSTIVGIVGDVKQASLAVGDAQAVYVPIAQWRFTDRALSLVARTRDDAATLAPAIRRAVWSVDKDQPIVRVATMDALVARSAAERRFALLLFEAFGLAALALAAIGIYGVLAGSVAERRREIGVRAALGASRRALLASEVRDGMALAASGVALGVAGASVASRALVTLLFGVSRLDVVTYAGVIALLAGVSAIACAVPAWRAARVDPSITLRAE